MVYKVDRLTRPLADFAKIVEVFDRRGVSFVSVTQQFKTSTSMGRLTLNMLRSLAQYEREITGERSRDKIAASNNPLVRKVRVSASDRIFGRDRGLADAYFIPRSADNDP